MSRRRDPRDALRLPQAIAADIDGAGRRDLGPLRRIVGVWEEAVGAALARMARPARLAVDGTLVVHVADASWMHAVQLEERTILRRLDAALGGAGPSALRAEIGPLPEPSEPASEPAVTVISDEARRRAEEMTRTVSDPRLRSALERAIAGSLSRRKSP